MAHFAIVCHPIRGRLYPQLAMGQALQERGHKVTVLSMEETHAIAVASGLDVIQADREADEIISMRKYPNRTGLKHRLGTILMRRLSKPLRSLGAGLNSYSRSFNSVFDRMIGFDLDRIFKIAREERFDCIIASDTSFACRTICEQLGIPMISSCTGITLLADTDYPPEYTAWPAPRSGRDRLRNRIAHRLTRVVEQSGLARLNATRRRLFLKPHRDFTESLSRSVYLSQMPEGFDFPQRDIGTPMHYLGPTLRPGTREQTDFPWDRLDGRPVVYVSSGTVNDLEGYFQRIAEACADLPVQVVMTRGGGDHPDVDSLAGDPLVVDYAPQLEVIPRASLVITHGSANTIVETLASGVPLLCIPQNLDQFGTGTRVVASGAGLSTGTSTPGPAVIRSLAERLLNDPSFHERAQHFKRGIEENDPVTVAVSVMESVVENQSACDDGPTPSEPFDLVADDGCHLRGLRFPADVGSTNRGTILALHGLSSDANSMQLIAGELTTAGYDVVVPDMRGHGLSDGCPGKRMTLARFRRDAEIVADALCEDDFTLLTQSYGGYTGLEMMVRSEQSSRIRALHAYAPPWRHRKQHVKSLPKNLFKTCRVLQRFGRQCGYGAWRVPGRQDYHLERDMPDFHEPMMHREIRTISLRRYARLLLRMRIDGYRRQPAWRSLSSLPVHLHLARQDRYVHNGGLERIASEAGWPVNWVECNHVGLLTNIEHARSFVEAVVASDLTRGADRMEPVH